MTANHRIPRRLFQFWHDHRAMPGYVRDATERTRALHRGYEYVLADDAYMAELIRRRLGERELSLYESNCIPASRADLGRCILLREHGGFYLDSRIELRAPFHEFVEADTELALGWMRGSLCNGFLGAIPGHPLFEAVLERALRNLERGYFHRDVSRATGPLCMHAALDHHGPFERSQRVDVLAFNRARERRGVRERGYEHWTDAQTRGIRPISGATPASPHDGAWEDDLRDDGRLLLEERAYLESRPVEGWFREGFPARRQRALNQAMTGRPDSSWRDDLAGRGPFPDLAMLTLAYSAADLEFVRSAGARRLAVYSPREPVLARIEAEVARRGWPLHLELYRQDLPRLELPARAFDLIFSPLTLHRVPNPRRAFAELSRALRTGGYLGCFEYVGEDRFQFSARRLAHAEAILDLLALADDGARRRAVVSPLPNEFGPFGAARSSRLLAEASAVLDERHRGTGLVAALPVALMYSLAGFWVASASDDVEARVLAYEESLRRAGEEGVLAYAVYQKSPEP